MYRYFFRYASVALSLVALVSIVIYYIVSNLGKDAVKVALETGSLSLNKTLNNFFEQEQKDVKYIAFLLNQKEANAEAILKQYTELHPDVYQTRIIDSTGTELLKYVQDNGVISEVAEENLQNKSQRTYFKDLVSLPYNEVYFSTVELNKEFGQIEIPYKPVLRFGLKYLDHNGQTFYLIINLNFALLVENLKQNAAMINFCSIYIADAEGQFYYHQIEDYTWGNTIPNRKKTLLSNLYPTLHGCLQESKKGFCTSDKGMFYYNTAYNSSAEESTLFNLVVHCNNSTIIASYIPRFYKWLLIVALFFIINLIPIWFWAKSTHLQEVNSDKLRENNTALNKANLAKDKFFRIISHDLRSPLNSILALSSLLKDELKTENEEVKEYANLLEESAFNAKKMINDLFEWAKSQTESLAINKTTFVLESLIAQTKNDIAIVSKHKNVHLKWVYNQYMEVYADIYMINTVLRNLISNAIKFSYPESTITITVEQQEYNTLFSVSDTGVGMPEAVASSIFELGKNHSTPGTNNEIGSGLGLVLCKEFVKLHQGEISVTSVVNKGTTIYFTLPNKTA